MTLRDALKLRPGDIVQFGDRRCLRDCWQIGWGEVLHVTEAGGVKIQPEWGEPPVWRGYHHLIRRG